MTYLNNKIKHKLSLPARTPQTAGSFGRRVFLCFCVFVLITGCGANKQKAGDAQKGNQQSPIQEASTNRNPWNNEMFSEASLDDLDISQQVSVFGTKNDDGSVTAQRIIIGDEETDFNDLGRLGRPQTSSTQNTDSQNPIGQPPQTFEGGERPDFERFQNMSEEERAKFREEMMAQRGTTDFPRRMGAGQNMARFIGEIIKKDDTSLTLKLKDQGSAIVFFSGSTDVVRLKEKSETGTSTEE